MFQNLQNICALLCGLHMQYRIRIRRNFQGKIFCIKNSLSQIFVVHATPQKFDTTKICCNKDQNAYHVYQQVRELVCSREVIIHHDRYAVAVENNDTVIGHLLKCVTCLSCENVSGNPLISRRYLKRAIVCFFTLRAHGEFTCL